MTLLSVKPQSQVLAEHYARAIYSQPDGWGMYCHPQTGEASHWIMLRLRKLVGEEEADKLIDRAMAEYQKEVTT